MVSKPKPSRHAPHEIDAYLAELPPDEKNLLQHVREVIRETVPDCTERVSYQIPIFRLKKDLVGISKQENHCSLHVMCPSLVKAMKSQLKNVKASGATIQFTPQNPIPDDLLTQILQARLQEIQ